MMISATLAVIEKLGLEILAVVQPSTGTKNMGTVIMVAIIFLVIILIASLFSGKK